MQLFRFVDDAHTTVRLNLNDGTIWSLGRGFDLGISAARRLYLSQDGVDGAVLADSDRPVVTMYIPLILYHQGGATFANIRTAHGNLATELDRHHNNLEWREDGDTASYFARTYRADIPSLRAGLAAPNMFKHGTGGPQFFIALDRDPLFTGAGSYI
jgi:hypothetical protein